MSTISFSRPPMILSRSHTPSDVPLRARLIRDEGRVPLSLIREQFAVILRGATRDAAGMPGRAAWGSHVRPRYFLNILPVRTRGQS